jgi:FAD/FMN-containing dehydrogenase
MNKVLDVDLQNMMIEVQAGIVTNEINAVVDGSGLFFAGYPMSLESLPDRREYRRERRRRQGNQIWRNRALHHRHGGGDTGW